MVEDVGRVARIFFDGDVLFAAAWSAASRSAASLASRSARRRSIFSFISRRAASCSCERLFSRLCFSVNLLANVSSAFDLARFIISSFPWFNGSRHVRQIRPECTSKNPQTGAQGPQ